MRIACGILILARMGSTRLPGKVLRPIMGTPVLEHMIRRLASLPVDKGIIVATTENPSDDELAKLCERLGVDCFRGDEENVLDRCINAAEHFGLQAVVRLGGDSPLCDRRIIGPLLQAFLDSWASGRRLDYATNTLDRYLPLGLDAEVFHLETLRRIALIAEELDEEERRCNQSNVVPYMHAHPAEFDMIQVGSGPDLSHHRWTLDTPEDFDLITRIYEALYPENPDFGMSEVLDLIKQHPDWPSINAAVMPVSGFWTTREREKFAQRYSAPVPHCGGKV
jgi:spore coat polysaccharide biosynthesis protein SpsF